MATKAQIFFPALSGLRFDGAALALGLVYFYEPGTTTERAIYTNRNKSATAANPYTLDANGQAEIFLDGIYDIVVTTAADVTKATWEGYEGSSTDSALNALEEVDTSSGDIVKTLPTSSSYKQYVKSTDDANIVTFTTSDGSTISEPDLQLDVDNMSISFAKVGTVWYRV